MSLLIHVAVPIANSAVVQNEIERCCAETHDLLIGRRVYTECDEVLMVVRVTDDTHLTQHAHILNGALRQHLIHSFQFESTNLMSLTCCPPCDIHEYMRDFPLQPSESWFPSIEDPCTAYVSVRELFAASEQLDWLADHHLEYHYL